MSDAGANNKRSIGDWFAIYTDKRILVTLALGFASGLPLVLTGATLGAWLADSGVDRGTLGTFALIALPYSFKFLWAPFIDRLPLPYLSKRFGRRRSWMLLFQALLMVAILALAYTDPMTSLIQVAWISVVIAFLSASQDVVIDAYRAEYLKPEQYGEGAATSVFGYRVGMLISGAGALALADISNWQVTYMVMAGFMLVGMVTVLLASEPEGSNEAIAQKQKLGEWLYTAVVKPFADFMQRHQGWWLILLLILFYRMPDGFIGFITTPFFLDIGFSKSEVAAIAKVYGFGATLLGMIVGGALIHRWKVPKCLMIFMFIQIIANLSYAWLAVLGPNVYGLMLAISMDNFAGGMVTAVAIAYMMSLCNLAYTATQYALLSSLASVASKTIAGSAGYIAEAYGWAIMFGLSALTGIPAIVVLAILLKRGLIKA